MFNLYIDESGKHDLKTIDPRAPHFSLAGILIHDNGKSDLKNKANQIKFKYWGDVNIVFHANDIRQQTGDFAIFKEKKSKLTIDDFYRDLSTFLNYTFKIGLVSINKSTYLAHNPVVAHAVLQLPSAHPGSNWEKQVRGTGNNLLKKVSTELLTMYLDYLNRKKANGEVIMESSNEVQDTLIYSAYNRLLTSGFPPFGMDATTVRKHFTGISFVTKQNHDIESQVADIAAHYLSLESRLNDGVISSYHQKYDQDIIKILKSKTFSYRKVANGIPENSYFKMY
ncbi:MAG: DUF3800 domain-containing protein [Patescibacteria group bacterium]